MKTISALLIGSTNIAEAHILTMRNLGIQVVDIATRLDSENVIYLKNKYNLITKKALDWKESVNKNNSNFVVVANKSELHKEISEYCLDLGKFVLCEKPGWGLDDLYHFNDNDKIKFAYNRRFRRYNFYEGSRKNCQRQFVIFRCAGGSNKNAQQPVS